MNDKTVAVFGATGFLGRFVTNQLGEERMAPCDFRCLALPFAAAPSALLGRQKLGSFLTTTIRVLQEQNKKESTMKTPNKSMSNKCERK